MTDNTDRLLRACEHPDRLTDSQIDELLADADTRELYKLLSHTADALTEIPEPDLDAEWQRFVATRARRKFRLSSKVAAAAAVVLLASIAVVATTIGIRHDARTAHPADPRDTIAAATAAISGPAPGAAAEVQQETFRNEPLADVITAIASHYGATVAFRDSAPKDMCIYFTWDKEQTLAETVEQLNTFKQINISLTDNTLTVE